MPTHLCVETWRDIPGFEGRYQVSDWGRVRSRPHKVRGKHRQGTEFVRTSPGRVLRPGKCGPFGHVTVSLGRHNSKTVHSLVLLAFVGPRPEGADVRHLDGDGGNNHLENLCYGTRTENNLDMYRHKRKGRYIPPEVIERIRAEAPTLPRGGRLKLARELGLNSGTITKIISGESYWYV